MAGTFDQADIGLELEECLQHVLRIADTHVQLARPGLRIAKAGQQGRENIAADGVARCDAQLHATLRGKSLEFVRLVEQRQRAREELPPGFVDAQAARHAVE
ncbi:hypothetical protein D3C81_1038910 [compost metagenome]